MTTYQKTPLHSNLFFLLMCCFAAAILGDSTAESLLLARYGTSFVPRMFLVNAFALFLLSAGMLSIIDRFDRRIFFSRALLVHAGILLLIRFAVMFDIGFLVLPLFSYAYSSKILFFLLFWTVANDCIDSRSAGSVFPKIAAGGTIGAIAISFSISGLMRFFAVENLLIVWAILCIGASLLLIPLRGHYRSRVREKNVAAKPSSSKVNRELFALLHEEPLIKNMSILYALIFFLLLNQHYIFYQQIKHAFVSAEKIAAFLGGFNGISMLLTCLLQISVAGLLLRKLGSTRSMLLLPTALLVVFVLQIVVIGTQSSAVLMIFNVIVAGMGIRIAFFDSFFSPNFQLFFSSLPVDIRGRGKLLIEGVVKPLSMVVAGMFLLVVAPKLSLTHHIVLLSVIASCALLQTLRLKHAYTKTLTRYLAGFDAGKRTDLLGHLDFSGGTEFLPFFAAKLDHEDFEVQKFIIEIIASGKTPEAAEVILGYLPRADIKLRATLVAALGNFTEALTGDTLKTFLGDSNERVVANAVSALYQCNAKNLGELLEPLLNHPHRRVRTNTIMALWPQADASAKTMFLGTIRTMLDNSDNGDNASALFFTRQIIEEATTSLVFDYCRRLVKMSSLQPIVLRQAVMSLGVRKNREACDLLLQLSLKTTNQLRQLITMVLGTMLDDLDEQYVCTEIEKGNAVRRNCLLVALRQSGKAVTPAITAVLQRCTSRENESIGWEKQSLQALMMSTSSRAALLSFAIREELIAIRIDNLLHIAALLDGKGVIAAVLPRLKHSDRHVRGRAAEVLENTGDIRINRMVLGLIDWLESFRTHSETTDTHLLAKEKAIAGTYCTSHNTWVALCAEYACEKNTVAT